MLLIWVYYSAQIVLFGAEFTHVYAGRRGGRRAEPVVRVEA
jgi:membrane protein